jgi:hypothetical protein
MSTPTPHVWSVKLMCSEYPEYPWPYGARALIAEREKVEKVFVMRLQMINGWRYGGNYANIFMVPLTFEEAFVRNDTERITLTDRIRTYHNFNWKRDVNGNPNMNPMDGGLNASDRHYAMLIDNLLEMQALTEELKPETLELVHACQNTYELQQAMLNARV